VITRTASRRFQHPTLDVIGLLHGFKALGEASRSLAGAPKRKKEQGHGEHDGAVAQSYARLALWDEAGRRLVSFAEARQMPK